MGVQKKMVTKMYKTTRVLKGSEANEHVGLSVSTVRCTKIAATYPIQKHRFEMTKPEWAPHP